MGSQRRALHIARLLRAVPFGEVARRFCTVEVRNRYVNRTCACTRRSKWEFRNACARRAVDGNLNRSLRP